MGKNVGVEVEKGEVEVEEEEPTKGVGNMRGVVSEVKYVAGPPDGMSTPNTDVHNSLGTGVTTRLSTTKLLLAVNFANESKILVSVSRCGGDFHVSLQHDTREPPNHIIREAKYTSMEHGTA